MARLFDPIRIGKFEVKNRIAFAASGTGYAHHDGSVSDQNLCHYLARAKGGAGWITIEHGLINDWYSNQGRLLTYHRESFTVGLRDLVEAIHVFGALAVVQLSLGVGRQSSSRRTGSELVSASPVPYHIEPGSAPRGLKHLEGQIGEVPHELSTDEVRSLEKAFLEAAERIQRVGFDGIEIHGAHGYLLASFLSPRTNVRGDEYGDSFEGRLRLPLNLIRMARKALGPQFLLGYRISGDEHVERGLTLNDNIVIAKILAAEGLDFIHLSSGSVEALKYMFPEEDGVMLPEAEAMKRALGIPVICPNIHDPGAARRAIEEGKVDMVSFSRQLLADPEWPCKVQESREKEIRRCKKCNYCISRLWSGFGIRCAVNSKLGFERFLPEYWPKVQAVTEGTGT